MKRVILTVFSAILITLVTACDSPQSSNVATATEPIIDVNSFSRITAVQLKEQLGEPVAEYDENWTIPSSGESYAMKIYTYDVSGYNTEFLVIEDAVVRMNIYASDNSENAFTIQNDEEMFALLNIQPRESLIEVEKNPNVLRYSSVSDTVGGVWTLIEGDKASIIKITYNFKYFD